MAPDLSFEASVWAAVGSLGRELRELRQELRWQAEEFHAALAQLRVDADSLAGTVLGLVERERWQRLAAREEHHGGTVVRDAGSGGSMAAADTSGDAGAGGSAPPGDGGG